MNTSFFLMMHEWLGRGMGGWVTPYVAERVSVGLWWTVVHSVAYWAMCYCVFWLERMSGVPEAEREANAYTAAKRAKIFRRVMTNHVTANLGFFVVMAFLLDRWRHVGYPDIPWFLVWPMSLLSVDWSFFLLHRLAHTPWGFKHIHYIHHEIVVAYAPAAAYCHWAEEVFVNMMAGVAAPLLFSFSDAMVTLFILGGTLDVVVAHSRHSTEHYNHHRYRDVTFGSTLGHVDRLLGTGVANEQERNLAYSKWRRERANQ